LRVLIAKKLKESLIMKRFIAFCMVLSLATVFSIGCDKKAEVKKPADAAAPAGTDAPKDAAPPADAAAPK
jgi:hypothetical protein